MQELPEWRLQNGAWEDDEETDARALICSSIY